ncbi:MAG: type II toxin-antitoxin system VapC family toxin [Caulobacteraceae bacterium]
MSATLVDTNVLLDIVTADPVWGDWSTWALDAAAMAGPVWINDVVYAEASVRFASIEGLDAVLIEAEIGLAAMPRAALFLAGKAFLNHRLAGRAPTGVLPDFFLGAHAAVARWRLLTRDAGRYRSYFPTIDLITPQRKGAARADV